MNENIRNLIESLPDRPARSKLAPYAEVILGLVAKRQTYREIAAFLLEHLEVSAAPSTIHAFVQVQARQSHCQSPEATKKPTGPVHAGMHHVAPAQESDDKPPEKDLREQIRTFQRRQPVSLSEPARFTYDPDQPLTLEPERKEK